MVPRWLSAEAQTCSRADARGQAVKHWTRRQADRPAKPGLDLELMTRAPGVAPDLKLEGGSIVQSEAMAHEGRPHRDFAAVVVLPPHIPQHQAGLADALHGHRRLGLHALSCGAEAAHVCRMTVLCSDLQNLLGPDLGHTTCSLLTPGGQSSIYRHSTPSPPQTHAGPLRGVDFLDKKPLLTGSKENPHRVAQQHQLDPRSTSRWSWFASRLSDTSQTLLRWLGGCRRACRHCTSRCVRVRGCICWIPHGGCKADLCCQRSPCLLCIGSGVSVRCRMSCARCVIAQLCETGQVQPPPQCLLPL